MAEEHSQHPGLFEKLSKAMDQVEEGSDYLHLSYQIGFHPKQSGMQLWVWQGDQLITRFEQFGIHALGLNQHGTPHSELDPAHRRVAQNLLRFAHLNSSEGFFNIPKKHVAFFIPKLARFHEVSYVDTEKLVLFSEHALTPLLSLKEQSPNKVALQACFEDSETGKKFNFSEVRIYTGRRAWAVLGETIFPIKASPLVPLLEDFNSFGELILYGKEAADFIQDYLPLLSRKPEVVLPQDFHVPEVMQTEAKAVYEINEDEKGEKLILTIHFAYDNHTVPPHLNEEDVMVELDKDGQKILLRRDLEYEAKVLKDFYEQGFHRVAANRFETKGDDAMDFLTESLAQYQDKGEVKGQDKLKHFNLFGELGEAQIKARAVKTGTDWLEMEVGFQIGGVEVPYEVIQALASTRQRYVKLGEEGFAKIDLESFARLEEKLGELETKVDSKGRMRVSQFHAAYLDESMQIDWSQNQDLGNMIRSLRETSEIPNRPPPEKLVSILREYQAHGYSWLSFLHDHHFHGILADDMGLGKTVQALSYLLDRKQKHGSSPNLVLAPTSVVFNWANEAKKFTPELKTLVLTGPGRKNLYDQIPEQDLVLTSYAIFRRDVEILTQHQWRTVILDEAQNIKNYRSKTALLVKELMAEQRWALTGTPLENRLSELWSIFDFLMPKFLGNYPHFKRKYQQPIEVHQSKEHLERLKKRIYPFVMRRLKDEVASELPPKTEMTQFCEMTPGQEKLYQEVMAACRRQVFTDVEKKGIEKSQVSILTALLRLRQVCCHPELLGPNFKKRDAHSGKMEAFKDLVLEVIEEGHRILVFSQFVEMLSLLREWLEESKIAYEYLDGRTKKREERVKRFNESEDIPIFLVSLRAGGTGLNLTGASYVIHYDPWWNPAVQDQATDRVHRIGQKKHVFSYKMITKDSVEEKILALQEKKRTLAKELLSADSALGKKLSYADLEFLFS